MPVLRPFRELQREHSFIKTELEVTICSSLSGRDRCFAAGRVLVAGGSV